MQKQLFKNDELRKPQIIQDFELSSQLTKEEILALVKASDDTSVNADKVLELKKKVQNGEYSVDFDAVGEALFEDLRQES